MRRLFLISMLLFGLGSTSFAQADPLATEEGAFVILTTSSMFAVAFCDYDYIPGSLRKAGEKAGVDSEKFHAAVMAAMGANSSTEDYDRKALIPEVTRLTMKLTNQLGERKQRDLRALCKDLGEMMPAIIVKKK